MPIFAFVFGYSLILMKGNLENKDLKVKSHFFKRALVLILFGLLHGILLWDGDILFLYGLMSIILLVFINRKRKTVIIWAVTLFSIIFVLSLFAPEDGIEMLIPHKKTNYLNETKEVYEQGTYGEILTFRSNDEAPLTLSDAEMLVVLLFLPFVIMPMFLFGMYAAHRKWFYNIPKRKHLYLQMALILIPIGILSKMTIYGDGMIDLSLPGAMILAIGYICLFTHVYMVTSNGKWMKSFENVGKLSLSNYILQTVICTYIFYGYGFGLFGKMGVLNAFLLGVVIFMIQIVGSNVYFYFFKRGPLERIVGWLVYFKFRRRRPSVVVSKQLDG